MFVEKSDSTKYFFNHILIDQKVHNTEGTEGSSLTT